MVFISTVLSSPSLVCWWTKRLSFLVGLLLEGRLWLGGLPAHAVNCSLLKQREKVPAIEQMEPACVRGNLLQ